VQKQKSVLIRNFIRMNISWELHADGSLQEIPKTALEALGIVRGWASRSDSPVPMIVTLTPIARYVDSSVVGKELNALAESETADLIDKYNDLMALQRMRSSLDTALTKIQTIFPTLYEASYEEKVALDDMVLLAREKLAKYLMAYRNGASLASDSGQLEGVTTFLSSTLKDIDSHRAVYQEHERAYEHLVLLQKTASRSRFPLVDIDELRRQMSHGTGPVGVSLTTSCFLPI